MRPPKEIHVAKTNSVTIFAMVSILLYFFAPMFLTCKGNCSIVIRIGLSCLQSLLYLPEAVTGATIVEPKELSADCIKILEMEKRIPCIRQEFHSYNGFNLSLSIRSCFGIRRIEPSLCNKLSMIITKICMGNHGGHATPSTDLPNTTTKKRFSTTYDSAADNQ